MCVVVDAHAHVRVPAGSLRLGQQIGEVEGAGVGRAFGHGENEVTIPTDRGDVQPVEYQEVSGEPAETYEVALIQSHERDEAARAGAPGNGLSCVSEQHSATIPHESPSASANKA